MFQSAPHVDELQVNMDTISKELNDLIVTGENEQMCRPMVSTTKYNGPTYLSGPNVRQNFAQYAPIIPQQTNVNPPHYFSTSAPQVPFNDYGHGGAIPKQYQMIPHHQQQYQYIGSYSDQPHGAIYHSVLPIQGQQIPTFPINSFIRAPLPSECNPKVEVHYLKRQMDSGNVSALPLLCVSADGEACGRNSSNCFKKFNRFHVKNIVKSEQEYDEIVVDLSTLGIPQNGKDASPVLRLFSCLRKLHNVLEAVPPSLQPHTFSAYVPTFAPMPNIAMPCTMNVRYQIRYASRKLNEFYSGLVQIVANNRMYEPYLSVEYYRYLINLLPMISQFDMYKHMELEHKRGEFVTEAMRGRAEGLEILLEKLTPFLSEVHLRIISYCWYIGKKYHNGEDVLGRVEHLKTNSDTTAKKHSKIGIVNEILQLCNTASIEAEGTGSIDEIVPVGEDTFNDNTNNADNIQCKDPINKVYNETNEIVSSGANALKTDINRHANSRQPELYMLG